MVGAPRWTVIVISLMTHGCLSALETTGETVEGKTFLSVAFAVELQSFGALDGVVSSAESSGKLLTTGVELFPSQTRESHRLSSTLLEAEFGTRQSGWVQEGFGQVYRGQVVRFNALISVPSFVCAQVGAYTRYGDVDETGTAVSTYCTPIPEVLETEGFEAATAYLEAEGYSKLDPWPDEVRVVVDKPSMSRIPCPLSSKCYSP